MVQVDIDLLFMAVRLGKKTFTGLCAFYFFLASVNCDQD